MQPYNTYTDIPQPPALAVTGAALRAVTAADERARSTWAALEAASQEFARAYIATKVHPDGVASAIPTAEAILALVNASKDLQDADARRASLVPRWRGVYYVVRAWHTGGDTLSPAEIIRRAVTRLHYVMQAAGVPVPAVPPVETSNNWLTLDNQAHVRQWLDDVRALGVM